MGTRILTWLAPAALLAACNPADTDDDTTDDTDTVVDTGDTDTDTDTEPDPNEIAYPGEFVSRTSWSLSSYMGSLPIVEWTQESDAPVTIAYRDGDGDWMSVTTQGAAGDNTQLLAGLPFEAEAEWTVTIDGSEFAGSTIVTDDIPSGFPPFDVLVSESDSWLPEGNYFLSSVNQDAGGWTGGTYWTFIIDREGKVYWAIDAPNRNWTLFAQVAVSKDHFLWDEATYWSQYDHGANSKVHRTYLDGEIESIRTPGLHHAFVQKPDTSLAWGSQYHVNTEALVEMPLDGTDDDIEVIWTCEDDWPNSRNCESNGLFFHEKTNTYLYSFYTNDSVVEVDQETGESLWWAGEVRGGYSFSPENAQFSWQHGISYTETGSLLLSSEARVDGSNRTVAWEYTVDHENQQLIEQWKFNSGVFASTNGDTWRLTNGNTLHVVGSAGHAMETTSDLEVVWQISFNGTHLLGRGEFIEDLWTLVSPENQPTE